MKQAAPISDHSLAPSAQLSTAAPRRTWSQVLRAYLQPPALRMLALGFSSGLPFLLLFGTLSFWLREAQIDRATIGHLSWIGLAFGFKWVWAPLVDKVRLPLIDRLGQRRSWLLLAQLAAIVALIGMALNDPKLTLTPTVAFAITLAFAAATQDIALDAFRIESASADEQGTLAAAYQGGYRVAMIWAGAGVLMLAARAQEANPAAYDPGAWRFAYLVMAASMLIGVITVLLSREPVPRAQGADAEYQDLLIRVSQHGVPVAGLASALFFLFSIALAIASAVKAQWAAKMLTLVPQTLWLLLGVAFVLLMVAVRGSGWRYRPEQSTQAQRVLAWMSRSFVEPFADFLRTYRWHAVVILALIAVYRISDIVMGVMANPFYVDMQFTKTEVASVTKIYGVIMTLLGVFIGGALTLRYGVMRVLMTGAILSALTNLLFAWLYRHGHDVNALIAVVSADNLSAGIASAAFVAYLSGLTNVRYSATQYALFSSMMVLLPKWLAGYSGEYVDAYGWERFFNATALLGIPVLVLIVLAMRNQRSHDQKPKTPHTPDAGATAAL